MKTLTDSALTINKIGRKLGFFDSVINPGCIPIIIPPVLTN